MAQLSLQLCTAALRLSWRGPAMSPPDIAAEVLEFIAANIDSVPQLEALLLMWESSQHHWSATELAARIYVTPLAAEEILQSLVRRHFVTQVSDEQGLRYFYDAGRPDRNALISQVAATYRRHLVHVATFIHRKASSSVREFARAFDLKKDR